MSLRVSDSSPSPNRDDAAAALRGGEFSEAAWKRLVRTLVERHRQGDPDEERCRPAEDIRLDTLILLPRVVESDMGVVVDAMHELFLTESLDPTVWAPWICTTLQIPQADSDRITRIYLGLIVESLLPKESPQRAVLRQAVLQYLPSLLQSSSVRWAVSVAPSALAVWCLRWTELLASATWRYLLRTMGTRAEPVGVWDHLVFNEGMTPEHPAWREITSRVLCPQNMNRHAWRDWSRQWQGISLSALTGVLSQDLRMRYEAPLWENVFPVLLGTHQARFCAKTRLAALFEVTEVLLLPPAHWRAMLELWIAVDDDVPAFLDTEDSEHPRRRSRLTPTQIGAVPISAFARVGPDFLVDWLSPAMCDDGTFTRIVTVCGRLRSWRDITRAQALMAYDRDGRVTAALLSSVLKLGDVWHHQEQRPELMKEAQCYASLLQQLAFSFPPDSFWADHPSVAAGWVIWMLTDEGTGRHALTQAQAIESGGRWLERSHLTRDDIPRALIRSLLQSESRAIREGAIRVLGRTRQRHTAPIELTIQCDISSVVFPHNADDTRCAEAAHVVHDGSVSSPAPTPTPASSPS